MEGGICWVSSTSLSPPAWAKVTLLRCKVDRKKCRGILPPIFTLGMFSFSATVVLILYFICSEQMIHKALGWSTVAVHLKTKHNTFIFHLTSTTTCVLEGRVTSLLFYPFPFSLPHSHLAACSSAEHSYGMMKINYSCWAQSKLFYLLPKLKRDKNTTQFCLVSRHLGEGNCLLNGWRMVSRTSVNIKVRLKVGARQHASLHPLSPNSSSTSGVSRETASKTISFFSVF